jgi:hypothetical protein
MAGTNQLIIVKLIHPHLRRREHLMIYSGPGFLAVVFGSYPHPHPVPHTKFAQHTGRLRKRDNFLTGKWVGGGGGAKSYDGQKAWSSINRSILSD